jgi:hypothetical protein
VNVGARMGTHVATDARPRHSPGRQRQFVAASELSPQVEALAD